MPDTVRRLDEALARYVRPQTFPVAARLLRHGEEPPAGAKRPSKEMGKRVSLCMGWSLARKYGWSVALLEEDMNCLPGLFALGLAEPPQEYFEGALCAGMYTETKEAGARTEGETPRHTPGKYAGALFAPLHRADFEPDLAMVYGNSAQVNILVCAALWKRGGRLHSSASGRLDCSDALVQTLVSGECQYILPCNGDRVFALTADDEMLFTVPYARFDEVAAALSALHKAGIRYPVPQFLRYEPAYPPHYEKMRELVGKTKR